MPDPRCPVLTKRSYANDLDEGYAGEDEEGEEEHEPGMRGAGDDLLRRKERSIVAHSFPAEQSVLERSRAPLIHHADSSDSLDNICPGERRASSSLSASGRQRTASSSARGVNGNGTSERSGSVGSVNSDGEMRELLDRDYKHKLGIACTVTKPPVHVFDEDEEMLSSELERLAMREFYEREGWLRAPRPSKATLEARKRTM